MRRFILLPLLVLLYVSCNESGMGIFYSISREQPLEDTTLPNNLSVSGMVKGTSKYYVCAGGLYSRDISAGQNADWDDEVAVPDDYPFCLALVEFDVDGNFYGLFSNINGDSTQIFTTPPDNIDWTAVGSFGGKIVSLVASETTLFVTESTDPASFVTSVSTDGTNFNTTVDYFPTRVTDAVYFGSDNWVISGPDLYRGSGTTYAEVSPSGDAASSASFGGLFVSGTDSLDRLFVSDSAGYVYATEDGSSWNQASVSTETGDPVALYDMEEVTISGAQVIVVGAKNGYYDIIFEDGYSSAFSLQIPGSEEVAEYSSSDANFLNIDLRRSVIRLFFFDQENNTLFAGTSGNGLWVNSIDTRKWDRQ